MSEILLVPAMVIAINIIAVLGIAAYMIYQGVKGHVSHI